MKKVETRDVPIKVVGSSRLIECPRRGILGAGYRLVNNCKKCGYYAGLNVKRNRFGLIEEGNVLCTFGMKWKNRNFGREPEAG